MKLFELYQERNGGSFTHDGHDYDLNRVLKAVEDDPVKHYNVSDLEWVLKYTKTDANRVKKADATTPILVTRRDGELVAIDGAHRLTKAVEDGIEKLPGKYVSADVLDKARKGERKPV